MSEPLITMRLAEWLGHQAPDIQEAMRQARAEALEQAAQVCEQERKEARETYCAFFRDHPETHLPFEIKSEAALTVLLNRCAAAIRTLK